MIISFISSLLVFVHITLLPPIVIDNGVQTPSCWEGNCVITVYENGEVAEVCQLYCNYDSDK